MSCRRDGLLHSLTPPARRTPPPALLPEPKGAFLGKLKRGDKGFDKVASEAARTVPGREHGGNCALPRQAGTLPRQLGAGAGPCDRSRD